MKIKKIISGLVVISTLAGCASQGGPIKKSHVGTLLGAAGGAAIGSNIGKGKGNIAAIAAGALLGGAVGYGVGDSLDKMDMQYMTANAQTTLEKAPIGQTSSWTNPDSGNSGSITPVKTYEVAGKYCREFNQTVNVGGKSQEGYGKACRQPDGSWEIQ